MMRVRRLRNLGAGILVAAAFLALSSGPAAASRVLLSESFLETEAPHGPPQGQIEGACGLAVTPSGQIYASDYYHRVVDLFGSSGLYVSQIALPGGAISGLGTNSLDGVCGLATDP